MHDMFYVVQRPVLMQQTAFRFLAPKQCCAGKRRRDGITRQVDMDPIDKGDRALEDRFVVGIKAENETSLNRDAMIVEFPNNIRVAASRVKMFACIVERPLADRFESDQQPATATLGGKPQELVVFRDPRGGQTDPTNAKGDHGAIESLGIPDILDGAQVDK